MNDYTKGPWTAKNNGIYGADGYGIAYPIGQAITKLGSDEYSHQWIERNQEANTRLIAAAPELLESLELAIDTDGGTTYNSEDDEVGERSCCGEVSYKPHRQDCWVVKARAAIAKAKGETK